MAVLTASSIRYGVDMTTTYMLTTVADTDTIQVGKGKTRVHYVMTGNPVTQGSAGTSYTYVSSTGEMTLYPGENSLGGQITVYPK